MDNHLVITEVTVHSEPLEGVAVGPSDPVQRMIRIERDDDHRDDEVFKMLRRIVKLMEGQPSISDAEIERFQAHVDHLVDENLTWEALAQEAEDGFMVVTDDLRRQLAEVEDRHQAELTEVRASHEDEIKKAERRSSELRERAERYRVKMDAARADALEAQREVELLTTSLQGQVDEMASQLATMSERTTRLQAENSKYRANVTTLDAALDELYQAARRREYQLITGGVYPISRFVVSFLSMAESLYISGRSFYIDGDVLTAVGMRDENGKRTEYFDGDPANFDDAIKLIMVKNQVTIKSRIPAVAPGSFVNSAKALLDETVGELPDKPKL